MHTHHQDTLFTICQTVNPMAAVGLMCRLLSDSVSSLLLSLTPKLYPALYFIVLKLKVTLILVLAKAVKESAFTKYLLICFLYITKVFNFGLNVS